jgi:hypothetical protein
MDDKNSSNVQHPFHAALMMFHATVRTAFETAAAFWRPWFREPEKKDVAARQHSKAVSEPAPQPTQREQEATEKKPKAPIKRAQRPKTLTQEATMEKKPKAPTKRSLKNEQELEREDRAQKTERLRKLRLAKQAADREKNPSSNGRDEAQHAIKE